MKCPKCQYLGFDGQTRCRNCGYDLSLSATAEAPPPAAQGDAVVDLPLRSEPSVREQARAAIQRRASRTPAPEAFDLPLFAGPAADERPAVPPAAPPLAVRRPTYEPPRVRTASATVAVPAPRPSASATPGTGPASDARLSLDLAIAPDADLDLRTPSPESATVAAPEPAVSVSREPDATAVDEPVPAPDAEADGIASAGARLAAGLVDAALLAVVYAGVLTATLQLTGLQLGEIRRLPLPPLVAFFALLAIGYLAMCTVLAGQTLGKMLMGIKVVEPGRRPVRFGHAVVRSALQIVTVPLLGLGFLPALLGAERRALYDRLAGTEVVRSTADAA